MNTIKQMSRDQYGIQHDMAVGPCECGATHELSDERIRSLRDEAGAAGDTSTVVICTAALAGDTAARARCVEMIADSAAMADGQ